MINQQLFDYIRQQLAAGVSKEQITKAAIGLGWAESDINEACVALQLPVPTPPSPPPFTTVEKRGTKYLLSFFVIIGIGIVLAVGALLIKLYFGLARSNAQKIPSKEGPVASATSQDVSSNENSFASTTVEGVQATTSPRGFQVDTTPPHSVPTPHFVVDSSWNSSFFAPQAAIYPVFKFSYPPSLQNPTFDQSHSVEPVMNIADSNGNTALSMKLGFVQGDSATTTFHNNNLTIRNFTIANGHLVREESGYPLDPTVSYYDVVLNNGTGLWLEVGGDPHYAEDADVNGYTTRDKVVQSIQFPSETKNIVTPAEGLTANSLRSIDLSIVQAALGKYYGINQKYPDSLSMLVATNPTDALGIPISDFITDPVTKQPYWYSATSGQSLYDSFGNTAVYGICATTTENLYLCSGSQTPTRRWFFPKDALDMSMSMWQNYRQSDGSFQISYPPQWKVSHPVAEGGEFEATSTLLALPSTDINGRPSLTSDGHEMDLIWVQIYKYHLTSGSTFDDFKQKMLQQLQSINSPIISGITKANISFEGYPTYEIDYMQSIFPVVSKARVLIVSVNATDGYWISTSLDSTYLLSSLFQPLVDSIVNSFKFSNN